MLFPSTLSEWFSARLVTDWFAITFLLIAIALATAARLTPILHVAYQHLRNLFLRYLAYTRLRNVPVLQYIFLLVHLGINVFCLMYTYENGRSRLSSFAEAAIRCGKLSLINMIPLFIGKRSSALIFIGLELPLHVRLLLHHWIGRLCAMLGLLHLMFSLIISGINWKDITISGIFVSFFLGLTTIVSVYPLRRRFFEAFQAAHELLAIICLCGLFWHLRFKGLKHSIYPIISISLWALGVLEMAWSLRTKSKGVIVVSRFDRTKLVCGHPVSEDDVIRLQINLNLPLSVVPGQYIYLRIRDFYLSEKFQIHPFMICWWEPYHMDKRGSKIVFDNRELENLDPEKMLEPDEEDPNGKALSLTLLIKPMNGITRRLSNKQTIECVSFDGPFGQQLHLECYDNVFLIAKGIGLAGIVSYAKQLLTWRSHHLHKQRVITRKLDIHWDMDDLSQERWGGQYLTKLHAIQNTAQEKGVLKAQKEKNETPYVTARLLQSFCYYSTSDADTFPSSAVGDPLLQYRNVKKNPKGALAPNLESIVQRSVGRSIIVVCGVSTFTENVRKHARLLMKGRQLEFIETEYRPPTIDATSVDATSVVNATSIELRKAWRPVTEVFKIIKKPVMIHRSSTKVSHTASFI